MTEQAGGHVDEKPIDEPEEWPEELLDGL